MKISEVLTIIALYYVTWQNFSSQKSSENLPVLLSSSCVIPGLFGEKKHAARKPRLDFSVT